jgi:hypothetical protein
LKGLKGINIREATPTDFVAAVPHEDILVIDDVYHTLIMAWRKAFHTLLELDSSWIIAMADGVFDDIPLIRIKGKKLISVSYAR